MIRDLSFSAALGCAALITGLFTAPTTHAADMPGLKATAEKIVGLVAGVKEGDRVVLRGDVRDIEMLEELSLAVLRRRADPLQLVGREKFAHRYFAEVPASTDSIPLALELKLVEAETVEIAIAGMEYPGLLDNVSSERLASTGAQRQAVFESQLKHGVRLVSLGNGLYPTAILAQGYGLTLDQLSDIYWAGINVDYAKMQATGKALSAILATGRQVRVTHPNGTDISCGIEKRPVFVSDGVISAEDVAKGGPALQVWLPAGEVYVTPVPGTAAGKVVFDSMLFGSGEIRSAEFTFKAGRLVGHEATASPAYDLWKTRYAAAPAGKDEFAFVDIGINPNVEVPPGSKLTSWVPAGAVSLGFGGNLWAGGANTIVWGTSNSMNGSTVTVDGKVIVENGELKVP